MLIPREPRAQIDSTCWCAIEGQKRAVSGKVTNVSSTGLYISLSVDIPLRTLVHLITDCDEEKTYIVEEILSNPNKIIGRVVRGNRTAGYGILLPRSKQDRTRLSVLTFPCALNVECEAIGDAAVLVLSGILDVTGAAALDRVAKEALKETNNIVLVMSEVKSVLSSGVGVLISLFRDVNRRGGQLAIAGPSAEVERVLSVSRADRLVSCYSSEEEALA